MARVAPSPYLKNRRSDRVDTGEAVRDEIARLRSNGAISAAQINLEWVSYTPTWANVTIGNGTVTAAYIRQGSRIEVNVKFVLGSTSAVSGVPQISLPGDDSLWSGYHDSFGLGLCSFLDINGASHHGRVLPVSPVDDDVRLLLADSSFTYERPAGGISATVPFTWVSGDMMWANFAYRPGP